MQIAKNPERAKKVNSIKAFTQFTSYAISAQRREQRKEVIADAKRLLLPNEANWQVHHADNRKFVFPVLDHVITDPPWRELEHYRWLAKMAQGKLKEGGLLAVQCAQTDFARIFPIFKTFTYDREPFRQELWNVPVADWEKSLAAPEH